MDETTIPSSTEKPDAILGDFLVILKALGCQPESQEVADAQALFGDLGERDFTPRGPGIDKDYLTFEYWQSGTMMQFGDNELLKVVIRVQPEWGWNPFPHSEQLLHGVTTETTREELHSLLGPTVKTKPSADTWQIGTRFLYARYTPEGRLGRLAGLLRADGS